MFCNDIMNLILIFAVVFVLIAISAGAYFYMNSVDVKYPHWGWGNHAGLRCKNNDNTGCNTKYVGGKLVEI
jgi:hypothetical protein